MRVEGEVIKIQFQMFRTTMLSPRVLSACWSLLPCIIESLNQTPLATFGYERVGVVSS